MVRDQMHSAEGDGGPSFFIELDSSSKGAELIKRLEIQSSLHYNNTDIQSNDDSRHISASNVLMLQNSSLFSEESEVSQTSIPLETQGFVASMHFWSLPQLIILLRSFDTVPYHLDNASIIQQCVGLIASKAATLSKISRSSCSSSDCRLSSNESDDLDSYSSAGLCEDIIHLSIHLLEMLMRAMISHHVDNKFLGKCLLHYLNIKRKQSLSNHEQHTRNMTKNIPPYAFERIVGLLYKLAKTSIPFKSLFGLQRMAIQLQTSKVCRRKIEEMIGFHLDKATLDNILVTRRHSDGTLYDVKLTLRLVKVFLRSQANRHAGFDVEQVKTVGSLLDKYLAEIAPDSKLGGSQFKAVASCLPDIARFSHDDLYHAVDIFLEAHPRIEEKEATELCKVIDFSKLSPEVSRHAAESMWFPPKITLKALLQEQESFKAAIGYDHPHDHPYLHHQHQHQHNLQRRPCITANVATASVPVSSSSFKSSATLKRFGSNVAAKFNSHQYQQKSSMYDKQANHDSQHDDVATNDMFTTVQSSPSSNSSFNWDFNSVHSHSNGSSRSLTEQMSDSLELPIEEPEQDDLSYYVVLQQNQELRMDLQLMQRRVSELEKACGKMKSKVSKYSRPKRLLC
ncbi:hypothetical protein KP509_05G063600 [Ceratopteris richardii]|nr:hypothetical protein KP509_05G063600 [Ceratopteris richardii]KAH7437276.1 hypothetical protein KP509_05G063600 [Ceratopteris richardii]KAH7437278.1 hypothetical protein KP509_05G063600 [Ceratopteris richardii]